MNRAGSLPADAALPQLAGALDTAHMAQMFCRHLDRTDAHCAVAQAPVSISNCSIRRIKYKPGAKCLIWYDLEIPNRTTGELRHQWYSARMFPPGCSLPRYRKALAALPATPIEPEVGPAVLHVESMNMVAWSFPNERKLLGLPALVDRDALVGSVLADVVQAGVGEDWLIIDAKPTIASYAPEYTCSVRVDLALRHHRTQAERSWQIYGKTYYDERGASTYSVMRELHAAVCPARMALVVPRPLLYQSRTRTLWQEAVDGKPLLDSRQASQVQGGAIDGAARALAGLHDADVECTRRVDAEQVAARLPALPALMRSLDLDGGSMATAVIGLLTAQQGALCHDDRVTLHGDLHAKNILVPVTPLDDDAPRAVALIDLDTLAQGPPAHDLGSWTAALLYRAVVLGHDLDSTFDLARRFVAAYRSHAAIPVVDADIRWHTAAALINERAMRAITRLKPGRLAHLGRIIHLAGEVAFMRRGWLK